MFIQLISTSLTIVGMFECAPWKSSYHSFYQDKSGILVIYLCKHFQFVHMRNLQFFLYCVLLKCIVRCRKKFSQMNEKWKPMALMIFDGTGFF